MLTNLIWDKDESTVAIKRKIDADWNAYQNIWGIWQSEASIDSRLEAGDPTLMTELNPSTPYGSRTSYYFNRVRPLLNMVSGYQRRNRKSCIVVPLENADQQTADQWTKILLGIFKRENVYDIISDAFHQGACVSGMNLLHVYVDYQNDPVNGDVKVENCAYNTFFIDPYFRKLDLSDCSFIRKRTYLTYSQAVELLPEYYNEIMSLQGNPGGTVKDGLFQYMPENYGQALKNKLAYDEYYYRTTREQKLLVDKITGEILDVSHKDQEEIDNFLLQWPQVELIKQQIPTVNLAIKIQEHIFYNGPQPAGIDEYPFVPVTGYYNPMNPFFYNRIQGIARSLRDPQLLYNRRVLLSADAAESVVNSGWIFKENAVIDVKHLFQTGQGRIIPLKEEAQMTDIQPIAPPNLPQYFFQLQDTFSKELNFVSGINEELMGSAIDDKAGILSALRQGAGLVTLQPLFDKLDNAQVMLGQLMMKVIRSKYTPGKIKAFLEGQEPAPLFYNKAFGKYHCMVQLGFNTESQRQMEFAQLVQLKELQVPIPDAALIEAATIQNKTEIMQMIQQQQKQAQQMQEQQAQVAIQEQQARTQLAQARAVADQGLGMERVSRIQENQALAVERRAEAAKDDQAALLNFAKALKEIEAIDLSHLEKIVSLQRMLKELENPQQPRSGSNGLDRGI